MDNDPTVLLTPQGQELLARLAAEPEAGGLALAVRLRREYPADLVAAATAQHELRLAARPKFSRAADMLFTRAGYEQSSSEPIARYRAERFGDARRVADLCCGIGGDLLALAAGREALAVDRDEVHARLALHNAAVYGVAGNVVAVVADVRDVSLSGLDAVFIDPARRSGDGTASASDSARPRIAVGGAAGASSGTVQRFRAGRSEPPLDWCLALADQVPAIGIKAAPGLPLDLVPDSWEAEFIADGRDLKEAVLWSPALATARLANTASPASPASAPALRRATVLSGSGVHSLVACPGPPVPLTEPGEYLLDPNPAVTRAGLVEDLARSLGHTVAKIDPRIAFLTLDRPARTPFARTLRVLDSAPWNEKRFAKRLRELGIGAADIRRRGLAGDVDQIHRRLRLSGPNRAMIVITRVNDRPWGLICADPASPAFA
jgi:hypothetical protein